MKSLRRTFDKVTRSFVNWILVHVPKIQKIESYDLIFLASVLGYGLVFSFFTLFKHNVFRSFAWDLGIFDQVLYTTLNGQFLHHTAELFMIPSGCYFASHFSPILLLVLPFYAIYPSSTTLLVLQAFVLASGAIPLYLVGKNILKDKKVGIAFTLLYLLYPSLQAANWFDFHTQIFLPLFLFSAYYFMELKRWKLYFLSIILALMIEEHVPIIVFLMAFYFLIVNDPRTIITSIKRLQVNHALASLITMATSVVWLFVAQYIKGSFFIKPEFIARYKATSAFSVLGIELDPLFLPVYILLNPQNIWNALMYDYPTKLFFLILLFGPLVFLPFKSKFSLVSLVLLVPSLLSNYLAYYTIGAQYPLYFVPLIFIALIIVVKQFHVGARLPILKIALMVSMLFIVSLSPLSPISSSFTEKGLVWYPVVSLSFNEDIESLHNLLGLIPPNSSVLTQNHIFPHVSARLHAYVMPPIGHFENDTKYLRELIEKSEYILLDLCEWDVLTEKVFNETIKNRSHGIYALGSRSLLFKQDYDADPLFGEYTEKRVFIAYEDLNLASSGQITHDLSVETGNVVFCPKGSRGLIVFGPFIYLLQGAYEVTFAVKLGEHDDSYIGELRISDNFGQTILSKRDIYGFELRPHEWTNFTLSFTSTSLRRTLEFLAFSSGSADIYIDKVFVKRVSSTVMSDFGTKTFILGNLILSNGSISEEGFFIHPHNVTSDFFWYGPYLNLSRGNYTVSFHLKALPLPQTPSDKIITLQVSADYGLNVIAEYDVYSSSFLENETISDWHEFTIEFIVNDCLKQVEVEFRGLTPSPDYDIYLAFVHLKRGSE